jgi:hypothetical protein
MGLIAIGVLVLGFSNILDRSWTTIKLYRLLSRNRALSMISRNQILPNKVEPEIVERVFIPD